MGYPWAQLGFSSLCFIALAVGCVDATTIQWTLSALNHEMAERFLLDLLLGAFGRIAGTFVFLVVSLEIRRQWSRLPQD